MLKIGELMQAQLNFSGPWENNQTLLQYLNTLPSLTLPNYFSTPCPYPTGSFPGLAIFPVFNTVTCCQILNFESSQHFWGNVL